MTLEDCKIYIRKRPMAYNMKPEFVDRNFKIYEMRLNGKIYREIGDIFNINKERVRTICLIIQRGVDKVKKIKL